MKIILLLIWLGMEYNLKFKNGIIHEWLTSEDEINNYFSEQFWGKFPKTNFVIKLKFYKNWQSKFFSKNRPNTFGTGNKWKSTMSRNGSQYRSIFELKINVN